MKNHAILVFVENRVIMVIRALLFGLLIFAGHLKIQ